MTHCLGAVVRFALVALVGLVSTQAHAVLIRADFVTQVTSVTGSGFGYGIGDTFAASLIVDTTVLAVDLTNDFPSPTDSYWNSTDTSFVVGNPAPTALARGEDYVYIVDDAGSGTDRITIQDRSETGQINSGAPYSFSLLSLNFSSVANMFTGTGLDVLSGLVGTPAFDSSFVVYRYEERDSANQVTLSNAAHGQLQSLTFSIVSVPEPTTIALFGAGLLGLGFLRRKPEE